MPWVTSLNPITNMPNDQYYTVLYQNWDIADRRFWIAWHRDCGNGRTGGLNLNQRCQRQMGFIMKVTTTIRLVG